MHTLRAPGNASSVISRGVGLKAIEPLFCGTHSDDQLAHARYGSQFEEEYLAMQQGNRALIFATRVNNFARETRAARYVKVTERFYFIFLLCRQP